MAYQRKGYVGTMTTGGISRRAAGSHAGDGSARSRIIRAAFELFAEHGFSATSMLEIATRAKLSKRDVYALYQNKHALLADCIGERTRAMRRPLALPAPESREALAATLRELGKSVLQAVCRPEVLLVYRLTIAESATTPELAHTLDANGRAANHKALGELIANAQARDLIGQGDPAVLAAHYFAVLWGSLLVELLMRLRPPPSKDEIEARARAATEAITALAAPPESSSDTSSRYRTSPSRPSRRTRAARTGAAPR
jgi:AcrR family transcriptional regulator